MFSSQQPTLIVPYTLDSPNLNSPFPRIFLKHTPLAWDIIYHVGQGETTDLPPLQYRICHMEVANIPPKK